MSEDMDIILARESAPDLATGTERLIDGFRTRFPQLSGGDIEILADTVLEEVGEHIGAGEDLAFIRRNIDGTAELTILGLKPLEEEWR